MKLFGSSPHRSLRNNSSRDSNDAKESTKRKSFAFMKYSPDRRSSASMKASREHARQIAMQLSSFEPEAAPLPTRGSYRQQTQPAPASQGFAAFPEPSAFDDFNPFGHDVKPSGSFSNNSVSKAPPQEDFFAQASPVPRQNYQRKSSATSHGSNSNRSTTSSTTGGGIPMRDNSFDNESVASSGAYDMDFLPNFQASQRDSAHRRSSRGRPPRSKATSSEVSFGSSTISWSQQTPQPQQAPPPANPSPAPKSMSTFPSNSSMQSAFVGQTVTPPTKPIMAVNMTPPVSGGGAAARRRMRSQLRHGSSGASLAGSETFSFDGTPPASPSSSRKNVISSNNSVGSSNAGATRNRLSNYTISGNWQSSPSPSFRGGGGNSVCGSSVAESDIDLFDSQNDGGFTFDAFGLDATEIDREVQEAMRAIEGRGPGSDFSAFKGTASTATNTSTNSKPQDTSMDDFAPQAWDSPPGSRLATPVPREQEESEDDGFVDGFRISKPSPLPLISVNRESPVSSERSSSLSSITDHNVDGGPRRNVFKEKAGFMSSNNRSRPSPVQAPKKQWVPPPGAVKMLTPPRHELPQERQQQRSHEQQHVQGMEHFETDNYWNAHLQQIPTKQNEAQPQNFNPNQQAPTRAHSNSGLNAAKWQSAANKLTSQFQPTQKFVGESSFRKAKEEEKKDDDASDRDNHTETTSAMTTVVSEPPPPSPQRPAQDQRSALANLRKLETQVQEETAERKLSPQEQRKKELEELRNGGSSTSPPSNGFSSQAALFKSNQETKQWNPQQQRVNECNGQRGSFQSLRERLKSPSEKDMKNSAFQNAKHTTPQPSSHRSAAALYSASKSEVGVSSFTRQKLKLESMSSSASKSEANFSRSPRNLQQQHRQPEVNAVLNRMRSQNNVLSPKATSPPAGPSPSSSTPAFVGVKLRKTTPPAAIQPNRSGEHDLQNSSPRDDVSPRHSLDQTNSQEYYRQQQREEQLQYDRNNRESSSPEGGWNENSPPMPQEKKLTYRERRELELAKERETHGQGQQETNEPKRDVADLIRKRIAANKTKNTNSPTNDDSQQPFSPPGQSCLRPTKSNGEAQVQSAPSDERRIKFAPDDEIEDYQTYQREEKTLRQHQHEEQSPRHFYVQEEPQTRSPPVAILPPAPIASAGGLSALHAQLKRSVKKEDADDEPEQERPVPAVSAGGLSALHAQLKQLKIQQPEEDAASGTNPGAPSTEKSAPRRVQAVVDGKTNFDKLEVTTANSQASDQQSNLSSPSRTPKATYAMLNAFLHGRDTVNSQDEAKDAPGKEEEDDVPQPPGSPPKASAPSSVSDGRPALKDDPQYARYFTMLKIGMPMDVVKHAMLRDNLDPAVMDGDHNKPACVGIPLKDDPKYAKYFKMLKIGMPMEAVKHAMARDGLDSHIMDQDHNLPAEKSQGRKEEGSKEKDSHRRARLHWKPVNKIRRNSLWAKIDEDPALDNIEIDEAEFAELFQAELQPDGQTGKKGKKPRSPRKGAAVRVIDPKRANNGGIILARLKMSHDDMADVVDRIDENCMTAEQIENIIEYLPTREERKALESYMLEGGQDAAEKFDGLCECEKFMVSMMTVKHAKRKVRALLFKLQFESCLEALYQETHTVESACDELSNSVRLRQLLGIILTFGNRLNTAGKGKKQKAGAFTLDSLLKLNQAKAFDKKTTFLQYIVLIVNRNNQLLLNFKDDLPTAFKADKVFWDQCVSDLEEVENQLENVRRIALYQARHASKFRRKKKKHHDGDDDEESLTDLSLSLEEEVEALRATPIGLFTLSAIKKVSFLRDRVENTKVKFNKLLEYFGEDEKRMQPHELFTIIVKFCQDFNKAKEQVMAEEKKKKREERKRQNANNNGPTPGKTPSKAPQRQSTGMLKASNMQPNASRLIQDMKRNSAVFAQSSAAATPPDQQVTPQTRNPPPNSDIDMQAQSHYRQPEPDTPQMDKQRHYRQEQQPHEMQQPKRSQQQIHPDTQNGGQNHRPPAMNNQHSQHKMSNEMQQNQYSQQHRHPMHKQRSQDQDQRPPEMQPQRAPQRSPQRSSQEGRMPMSSFQPSARANENYEQPSAKTSGPGRPNENGSSYRGDIDDVIPPGMQDQGRLEQVGNQMSESQSSAAMRRKARARGRMQTSEAPQQDPPAYSATQEAAPQMYTRQSSAPEDSAGAPYSPDAVAPTNSAMRNKLRNKRMLERKQRVLGRTSPTPNA